LILNCDEDRSQLKTRRSLPSAFCKLLKKLEVPKERKATRVPKGNQKTNYLSNVKTKPKKTKKVE
jgi:hypothetical protein